VQNTEHEALVKPTVNWWRRQTDKHSSNCSRQHH